MTSPLVRWAFILGLVLNAAGLHAQTTEEPAPEPNSEYGNLKILPFPGLRYGAPLGASLYGGLMLGRDNPVGYTGPHISAEVGQDGMRASVGMSMLGVGTQRAQLSIIRTWDNHGDVQADQTYLGPEIALGLIAGITVGYYWRISDGGGKARFFAIGSFIGA